MISEKVLERISKKGIPLALARQWEVRDAITPKISYDESDGEARLIVGSNGSAGCYGGWELVYDLEEGTYFTFRIRVSFSGLKRGIVHGATDEIGFHAIEHRHYVTDIHATILKQLGLDSRQLEIPGRKRLDIDHGQAINDIIA